MAGRGGRGEEGDSWRRVVRITRFRNNVNSQILGRRRGDAVRALCILGERGVGACRPFSELRPTRKIIQRVPSGPFDCGSALVSFASIVPAPGFKCLTSDASGPTSPTVCLAWKEGSGPGSMGTFGHMVICLGPGSPPGLSVFLLDSPVELTRKVDISSPGYSVRFRESSEVSLGAFSASLHGEKSFSPLFSFARIARNFWPSQFSACIFLALSPFLLPGNTLLTRWRPFEITAF